MTGAKYEAVSGRAPAQGAYPRTGWGRRGGAGRGRLATEGRAYEVPRPHLRPPLQWCLTATMSALATTSVGSLQERTEDLLELNRTENGGPGSVAQAFVGTDGIMMKTTTIDAVKQYSDLEGAGTMLDSSKHRDIAVERCMDKSSDSHERVCLPKIQGIKCLSCSSCQRNATT